MTAATTAASAWVYYIALRIADFPGLIIACFSAVAAILGIVFGLLALKEVGAAAYASRPLVRCGIVAGLLALAMAAAWIFLFFSGAGVIALEPEQEERLRPPQQVAGFFDVPRRFYEHV